MIKNISVPVKVLYVLLGLCAPVSLQYAQAQLSELYAPMSVSASDGDYSDKVGITWDAVRNASLYRVYRSQLDDFATADPIAVTRKGFYFDEEPQFENVAASFFYWVVAESNGQAGPESESDHGYSVVPQFGPDRRIPQLAPPPEPPENPVTAAKAFLGKTLFWEEQLSATNTMACGTCHQPSAGGNDQRSEEGVFSSLHPGNDGRFNTPDDIIGSPGVVLNGEDGSYLFDSLFGLNPQVTNRKAKDMIDSGYGEEMAWDGRISGEFVDPLTGLTVIADNASLESQVIQPPINTAEMAHIGMNWSQIVDKIEEVTPLALSPSLPESLEVWIGGRSYPELFQEVYGDPVITATRVAFAVATYERTLFGDRTAFDRVNSGIQQDHEGIKNLGRNVFQQSRCDECHTSENNPVPGFRGLLADNDFHYIGVRPQNADLGRFTVTGNNADRGRIKTPNLRNVGQRSVFMMDGKFSSLEEVVDFYDRGGDFNAPNKSNDIRNLNLNNNEKRALVSFLREDLTDPRVKNELPPFDRPTLFSESAYLVPRIHSGGVAGAEGTIPRVAVAEPPIVGNSNFTIGISESLAGSEATLVVDIKDPGEFQVVPEAGAIARSTIQLSGSGSEGWGSTIIEIPYDASLIGQTLYGRWYVAESADTSQIAVSPVFTFTPFGDSSVEPTSVGENRLYNLSIRANLVAGRNLIAGFVVDEGEKDILLRAAGPSLNQFGLAGFADTEVVLFENSNVIDSNDDWDSDLGSIFDEVGAFDFEVGSRDAALVATVSGLRTAIIPAGSENGVVLVEVYDAESQQESKLVNLSARYHVGTGDEVLIAGFTVLGEGNKRVLIRGVGPELDEEFGIENCLVDPVLEVFDSNGLLIASNNDWSWELNPVFETVGAFPLSEGSTDAAVVLTLAANATYTAIVSGSNNSTGEALVEVYEIE